MAVEKPDLDEAIRKAINLGDRDPLTIARKLVKRYGHEWVVAELTARDEEIIANFARHILDSERRSKTAAIIRSTRGLEKEELLSQSVWIPVGQDGNGGWMRLGDMTASDLRARANYHERMSSAHNRWADWFTSCAVLVEMEEVVLLKEVSGELPEIEEAVKIRELANGGS